MRLAALSVLMVCQIWLCGCNAGRSSSSDSAREWKRTVSSSTALLLDIMKKGNAVPDAILNLTKCVVVFPGGEERQRVRRGTAACRTAHDKWDAPVRVTLTAMSNQASFSPDNLLLFLIGDPAARTLGSNELQVSQRNAAPGPTVDKVSTITDVEIKPDLLVYAEKRSGQLQGASIAGVIRRDVNLLKGSDDHAFLEAVTAFFNSITPIGIIIHHSSTVEAERLPSGVREVDQFHAKKQFDILCEGQRYHVAYHYLVLPNGQIQAGRPEHCEGAHAESYNAYLGISVVGDFSSRSNPRGERGITRPTKEQFASVVTLCRRLAARYHIPLHRVMRHSDVARTECPGNRFPFRQLLAELE